MMQLFLIGNLGADAQIRETNGSRFLSMNVAHTERYKDVETTYWVSVTLNRFSEKLLPYLKKGTKICAYGKMTTRIFRGNDGQNHVGINLMADNLELCSVIREEQQAAVPEDEQPF